jgi:hypothetical protein
VATTILIAADQPGQALLVDPRRSPGLVPATKSTNGVLCSTVSTDG